MAATTAHAQAKAIVFLVDVRPNLRSSTILREGPSSGAAKRDEHSTTRCCSTGYSGRLSRSACFAPQHRNSTRPPVFPRGLVSEQEHNRRTGRSGKE